MKIGILTLHSQTNYGGVLQAFALQEVLKGLGHEVVIIDRWMDERNGTLKGITASRSVVGWVKFIGRTVLGFGDGADYIRHVRTKKMLPSLFNLTPYSFHHWKDAPTNLGVDVVVVGSDQVWNPGIQGDELPYLLEGAPNIPAIAYAASFGTPQLPLALKDRYRDGLKKFASISVREKEAVGIVESLGATAAHVLDPTLLVESSIWKRFMTNGESSGRPKLVCYLIHDPLGFVLDELMLFAKKQDCDIEIFFGGPCTVLPSNVKDLIKISFGPLRAFVSLRVHTMATSTPVDFVREISSADWVLTDSFHALMFSTIFNRNIRVLKPRNGRGAAGFARLKEFALDYAVGNIICASYGEAFASFRYDAPIVFDEQRLKSRREFSLDWLKEALRCVSAST